MTAVPLQPLLLLAAKGAEQQAVPLAIEKGWSEEQLAVVKEKHVKM